MNTLVGFWRACGGAGAALLQQQGISRLPHLLIKQHQPGCVQSCAAVPWLLAQVTCCKPAQAPSCYTAVVALLSCNNSVKENKKPTTSEQISTIMGKSHEPHTRRDAGLLRSGGLNINHLFFRWWKFLVSWLVGLFYFSLSIWIVHGNFTFLLRNEYVSPWKSAVAIAISDIKFICWNSLEKYIWKGCKSILRQAHILNQYSHWFLAEMHLTSQKNFQILLQLEYNESWRLFFCLNVRRWGILLASWTIP